MPGSSYIDFRFRGIFFLAASCDRLGGLGSLGRFNLLLSEIFVYK